MSNSWISALKQWNADKPKWTIPKKGSKEYKQVKNIMHEGVEVVVKPDSCKLNKEDKKMINNLKSEFGKKRVKVIKKKC